MRDRAKKIQAALLKHLNSFNPFLSHDDRAALADLAAWVGEVSATLEKLERLNDGKR